jgi:hypothetical protein
MPSYFVDDEYVKNEIIKFSGVVHELSDSYLHDLGKAFVASSFQDNLTIVFLPSSDDFNNIISKGLVIDFCTVNRGYQLIEYKSNINNNEIISKLKNPNANNIELLTVRASSLIGALSRGLPLEDLSIGFQIKMFRVPNVYNFKFWNHFTNIEFIKSTYI